MRGADCCKAGKGQFAQRFIPTCVGRTRQPARPAPRPAVHPHMRGADNLVHGECPLSIGSSSRACGRCAHRPPGRQVPARFIPTRVGQTTAASLRTSTSQASVHPHIRGADCTSLAWSMITRMPGSSPHAHGADDAGGDKTPARRSGGTVHTHARGSDLRFILVGSPALLRFIPTRVGQTPAGRPSVPHEAHRFIPTRVGQTGPRRRMVDAAVDRFIPTCVGRTMPATTTPTRATVHPHMRGADASMMRSWASCVGSSPHAWGGRSVRMR